MQPCQNCQRPPNLHPNRWRRCPSDWATKSLSGRYGFVQDSRYPFCTRLVDSSHRRAKWLFPGVRFRRKARLITTVESHSLVKSPFRFQSSFVRRHFTREDDNMGNTVKHQMRGEPCNEAGRIANSRLVLTGHMQLWLADHRCLRDLYTAILCSFCMPYYKCTRPSSRA